MYKTSARALVIRDHKVLLMFRNKYGDAFFAIPGGGIEDYDSDYAESARREVFEETSININVKELLFKSTRKKTHGEQHLFLGEYIDGNVALEKDSIEMIKMTSDPENFYLPMWVNVKSALKLKIRPDGLEKFVKEYIKQYK